MYAKIDIDIIKSSCIVMRRYVNLIWVFLFLKLKRVTIEKIINKINTAESRSSLLNKKSNKLLYVKDIYSKKHLIII